MQKGKFYFSDEHKFYKLKVEMSLLPNDFVNEYSKRFYRLTSNISIMSCRAMFHLDKANKKSNQEHIQDFEQLFKTHSKTWVFL